jgi:hypothetical protein
MSQPAATLPKPTPRGSRRGRFGMSPATRYGGEELIEIDQEPWTLVDVITKDNNQAAKEASQPNIKTADPNKSPVEEPFLLVEAPDLREDTEQSARGLDLMTDKQRAGEDEDFKALLASKLVPQAMDLEQDYEFVDWECKQVGCRLREEDSYAIASLASSNRSEFAAKKLDSMIKMRTIAMKDRKALGYTEHLQAISELNELECAKMQIEAFEARSAENGDRYVTSKRGRTRCRGLSKQRC